MSAQNLGGISSSKVEFFHLFATCSFFFLHIHTWIKWCQLHTWMMSDSPGRLSRHSSCLTAPMFPQMRQRRLASRSCRRDPSSRGIMWRWSVTLTATLSPAASTFTWRSVRHRQGFAALEKLVQNSASVPPVKHSASHLPLQTFKVPFWNCHKRGTKGNYEDMLCSASPVWY